MPWPQTEQKQIEYSVGHMQQFDPLASLFNILKATIKAPVESRVLAHARHL